MKQASKKRVIVLIISSVLFASASFSQVVITEKAVIHVDNVNSYKPEIKLLQPIIFRSELTIIETDVLKVLGKLINGNGKEKIIVNKIPAVLYGDSLFYTDLSLVPGPNQIKIEILADNKVINTYNYTVVRNDKQANSAIPAVADGKYYALIIGINKYLDPLFNELDHPIKDAEMFYNAITTKYTFEKEDVKFLQNATMEDMVGALDYFAKKIRPEDNFLIFYAGHGVWDKSTEIGFWLPSDAKKNSTLNWFRNSTLRDYLKSINSKHTLLISDACFSGSIFKSRSANIDAPLAIKKLYELPSRKAMTSGTLTEVPDQSAFLKYLVERLDSNTEKYLSSEQLYSSFRIAVMNNSPVTPQFGEIKEVGDQGGDFIFILRNQ
jgi:hypothetical protein